MSALSRKLYSGMSHSYSTQGGKHLANNLTRLTVNNIKFDGRAPDLPAINQGVVTQLSEHISSLNERMDEFTSRIEELNCKLIVQKSSMSQQNLSHGEVCNGSAPTSLFVSGLGNGTLVPNSSSSSQLSRDYPLTEELAAITRGQRQIMHQLDNLHNLLHNHMAELSRQGRNNASSRMLDLDLIRSPLIITLVFSGIGILLFKGLSRN